MKYYSPCPCCNKLLTLELKEADPASIDPAQLEVAIEGGAQNMGSAALAEAIAQQGVADHYPPEQPKDPFAENSLSNSLSQSESTLPQQQIATEPTKIVPEDRKAVTDLSFRKPEEQPVKEIAPMAAKSRSNAQREAHQQQQLQQKETWKNKTQSSTQENTGKKDAKKTHWASLLNLLLVPLLLIGLIWMLLRSKGQNDNAGVETINNSEYATAPLQDTADSILDKSLIEEFDQVISENAGEESEEEHWLQGDWSEQDLLDGAQEGFSKFLKAKSPTERAELIIDSDRVALNMESELTAQSLEKLNDNNIRLPDSLDEDDVKRGISLLIGDPEVATPPFPPNAEINTPYLEAAKSARNTLPVAIFRKDRNDNSLLDWETFQQTRTAALSEFLAYPEKSKSETFRVIIARAVHLDKRQENGEEIAEDEKLIAVRINAPATDPQDGLKIITKKNSSFGQQILSKLKWGTSSMATLDLQWKEDPKNNELNVNLHRLRCWRLMGVGTRFPIDLEADGWAVANEEK